MIERQLSNHVETNLARVEQELSAAEQAVRQANRAGQAIIDRWERAALDRAWWQKLLGIRSGEQRALRREAGEARVAVERVEARAAEVRTERDVWAAGREGERILPERWRHLSDEWVLLNGCTNNRGEIDHLLLGPPGLWAIEVKNRKVELTAEADDWRYRSLDGYGNVVGEGRAADRNGRGRTWGREVADPAEALARQLARAGLETEVRTAVVLVAEPSRVASRSRAGVDLVTADLDELDADVIDQPARLDVDRRHAIDRAIVDHHRYHERKRAEREAATDS